MEKWDFGRRTEEGEKLRWEERETWKEGRWWGTEEFWVDLEEEREKKLKRDFARRKAERELRREYR